MNAPIIVDVINFTTHHACEIRRNGIVLGAATGSSKAMAVANARRDMRNRRVDAIVARLNEESRNTRRMLGDLDFAGWRTSRTLGL